MKNKCLEQTGHLTEKPIVPYDGLTEGNDWTMNTDGSWFIPSVGIVSEIIDTSQESYSDTFAQDQITLKKCATPMTDLPLDQHTSLQSNTGANANITLDSTLLQEVQWVEPVHCDSSKKGATLEIQAIGKYIIPGTTLSVNMYYCPNAHGTILSTTAMVRQNWHLFVGYQKMVNMDSSTGHIKLIAWDGFNLTCIPIYLTNDLCYHYHSHSFITEEDIVNHHKELFSADGTPITLTVNHL